MVGDSLPCACFSHIGFHRLLSHKRRTARRRHTRITIGDREQKFCGGHKANWLTLSSCKYRFVNTETYTHNRRRGESRKTEDNVFGDEKGTYTFVIRRTSYTCSNDFNRLHSLVSSCDYCYSSFARLRSRAVDGANAFATLWPATQHVAPSPARTTDRLLLTPTFQRG